MNAMRATASDRLAEAWFVARRMMNARPQEVTRLVDLHHPTKIDTIAAALQAMTRRLHLRLV